jgi:hypothetical protein
MAPMDGWDIPTLEDWYTLLFDIGAKMNMMYSHDIKGVYCDIVPGEEMTTGGIFNLYLKFDYVRKNYLNDCGSTYIGGASYWTKTRFNYLEKASSKLRSNNTFIKLHPTKWNDGIERVTDINPESADSHDFYPIRCIKKTNKPASNNLKGTSFVPYKNSGSVYIDGVIYKTGNLLTEGVYLPVGQKQVDYTDYTNSIMIKYIGEKMFFLIYEKTVNHSNMVNYHILNSNDGHFKLAQYYNGHKNEMGEFIIKNKTTFTLTKNSEIKEYKIIPNLKVSWTYSGMINFIVE